MFPDDFDDHVAPKLAPCDRPSYDPRPWEPLLAWVKREPDIIGRAGYQVAVRCAVPRADADDAVSEALTVAWRHHGGRGARSANECVVRLRKLARRVLLRTRSTPDEDTSDPPSGWSHRAMEAVPDAHAAGKLAVATLFAKSPTQNELTAELSTKLSRLFSLLQNLGGDTTLEEVGEARGLTKERVRQLRDDLLEHLRRWAAGHVVFLTRPPLDVRCRKSYR